jgi:hypothetical protein
MYFLNVSLTFALSFLRTVTLGGKLLTIFMPAQKVLFWTQDRLAFGLQWWCLFIVLILCIDELVWKISWLLIIKLINASIYWDGTRRISNCLNRLLQEVLGWTPAINLMISYWKWKSSHCWKGYPQKIIPYFIMEWKYA